MLIKYTFGPKSQTLRMRDPFQSTGRPISHRNGWSFGVYMIPLRDFVKEWNSRPGARTGMKSRAGIRNEKNKASSPHTEPEWTRSGAKVAPVSCKHTLSSCSIECSIGEIYLHTLVDRWMTQNNENDQPSSQGSLRPDPLWRVGENPGKEVGKRLTTEFRITFSAPVLEQRCRETDFPIS